MPQVFIPKATPPQISSTAKEKLVDDIFTYGLENIWTASLSEFRRRQPTLYPYLKLFDFLDSEGQPLEDDRPKRAFRYGAVLTELAYQESGYDKTIEDLDTFTLANLEAKYLGIPEAYIIQSNSDQTLEELVAVMTETPQMRDGVDVYDNYEYFVRIGAACTRHYLQFALTS